MTRNGFWQFLDMYMCGVGYTIQQTNSYIWYLETKKEVWKEICFTANRNAEMELFSC